ncbi:MAG: hypothetical protein ABSD74_09715 [Rhizomicrobium sp.]|jgi:hypothetical protein
MVLAVAACAREAPPLPAADTFNAPAIQPAMSEQDRLQRCSVLVIQVADLRREMATIEDVITGHRQKDQVEGYLADVLFPPALLAIDQEKTRKAELDERQKKIDDLLIEQHALHCPAGMQ